MEAIGLPQDNKSENLGGNTMRKYAETLVNYVGDKSFKHCGNHMVKFIKAVLADHASTWKCACGGHHFSMVKGGN